MAVSVISNDELTMVMYREHLAFKVFQVDRISGLPTLLPGCYSTREACFQSIQRFFLGQAPRVASFDAFVGIVPGFFRTVLIMADAKCVGEFFGFSVFQVRQVHFIDVKMDPVASLLLQRRQAYTQPFLSQLRAVLERQTADCAHVQARRASLEELVAVFDEVLEAVRVFPFESTFYSPDVDLSGDLGIFEQISQASNAYSRLHTIQRHLSQFCANSAFLAHLFAAGVFAGSRLVFGDAACFQAGDAHWFTLTRQSILNAGTRYNARGLNARCAAANEYETEILVWRGQRLCGLKTLRGSAPIFFRTENAFLRAKFTVQQQQLGGVYWAHKMRSYSKMVALSLLKERSGVRGSKEWDGQDGAKSGKAVDAAEAADTAETADETILQTRYREAILEQAAAADGREYYMIAFPWHAAVRQAPKNVQGATTSFTFSAEELVRFHANSTYTQTIAAAFEMLRKIHNTGLLPDISIADVQTRDGKMFAHRLQCQKTLFRINCADSLDRTNLASYFFNLHVATYMYEVASNAIETNSTANTAFRWWDASQLALSGASSAGCTRLTGSAVESVDDGLNESGKSLPCDTRESVIKANAKRSPRESRGGAAFAAFEQEIFDFPAFLQFSQYFCHAGDVISLFYTQSPSSHSQIWDVLLEQKRQSNAAIGVRRKLQNTFSDERKNQMLQLFFGTDIRLQVQLLPLGALLSANDGFSAAQLEQWLTRPFIGLQNRYFEYEIRTALQNASQSKNALVQYLQFWRDIFMQRGNSDFSHYYLFTHNAAYHSQDALLAAAEENAFSSLNSQFTLRQVVSRGRQTAQSRTELFNCVFGPFEGFYQASAAQLVNFEQYCAQQCKNESATPRHYVGDCFAVKIRAQCPLALCQLLVTVPASNPEICTPDSLTIVGKSVQGWDFCVCNFTLPVAQEYQQLLLYQLQRLNLPLSLENQAVLQQLTQLYENVSTQSLGGSYALLQPELTLIFKVSQQQIVKLPKISLIGKFCGQALGKQLSVPKSAVEWFARVYDLQLCQQLAKIDEQTAQKIVWLILARNNSTAFMQKTDLKASQVDPAFADLDHVFDAAFALNKHLFASGASLAFFSSLFNAYGSDRAEDAVQLRTRLCSQRKTLKASYALSEHFGDCKIDFQELLQKCPSMCAIQQGQLCACCKKQAILFQCQACDTYVCQQCADDTLSNCVLGGVLLGLTLLCKPCSELNARASGLVLEYCRAFANSHESLPLAAHRYASINGGALISQACYTISDSRIIFDTKTSVAAFAIFGAHVVEILADGRNIEFTQTLDRALCICQFKTDQIMELQINGCNLQGISVYGQQSFECIEDPVFVPQLCKMQQTTQVIPLTQSILDQYHYKSASQLTFHFVFRSAAKISRIRIKTTAPSLQLPNSFVLQYRNFSELDSPKKFKKQIGSKPKAAENQDSEIILQKRYVCAYQLHCCGQSIDYVQEAIFVTEELQMRSIRVSVVLENIKIDDESVSLQLFGSV